MKMKCAVLLTMMTLCISAQDRVVTVHEGFFNGEKFRTFGAEKNFYAAGIVDGILLAPLFGAPKPELKWFEDCVAPMTNTQIAAIIGKYLENHPAEWHQSVNFSLYAAMREACHQR